MGRVELTKTLKIVTLLSLWLPFTAAAQTCRPELHSDIQIDADSVIIEQNNNRFRIEPNGNLYVDVHRISLNDAQKASLSAYSKSVRDDLPYIGRSLSEELNTSWMALDDVIVDELGNDSALRGELGQFHQYLQGQVASSLYAPDRSPHLKHQALASAVREIEASVPQLVATISSRGLMDIANLSLGHANKMQFISEKMLALQNRISDEVKVQQARTRGLRQEVCSRLSLLQAQESEIGELIPALSGWKTVTVTTY